MSYSRIQAPDLYSTDEYRVLKEQVLLQYHRQRVLALLPDDFQVGVEACTWLCQVNNNRNPRSQHPSLGGQKFKSDC